MNEFTLLARCCAAARGLPVPDPEGGGDDISRRDEGAFIALAKQHKVPATAFAGLKALGLAFGAPAMRDLKRTAASQGAARLLLMQEWPLITEAFKSAGIPCLTIKGPASSLQLYGSALTREFGDLDLLVNVPELSCVVPIMKSFGYNSFLYSVAAAIAPHSALAAKVHHAVFQKEGRPSLVEVHGRTWTDGRDLYREDIDALFARSTSVTHNGVAYSTLSLADQGVFLIAHGVSHAWCLLHWVLDAAALFNRSDEALHREMAQRIVALGMERQLKLTVGLIKKLFPILIPEPLMAIVAEERRRLKGSLGFARESLHVGGRKMNGNVNIFRLSLVYLMPLAPRFWQKLSILTSLWLTPQSDIDALPLPRFLRFLYIPLRPFFVIPRRIMRTLHRRRSQLARAI